MIHLRGRQADVVIDESFGAPVISYWGAPLGSVDVASVSAALARPAVQGGLDVVATVSVVPEHGSGFQGRAGLSGHRRGGRAWAPRATWPPRDSARRRWKPRREPTLRPTPERR
jgi:alpha-galactosidase